MNGLTVQQMFMTQLWEDGGGGIQMPSETFSGVPPSTESFKIATWDMG
jgi:hypothetical protein